MLDGDRVVGTQATRSVIDRDTAPRQQRPEALEQVVDHPTLAFLADSQIDARLATTSIDAEVRSPLHRPQHRSRLKQFLGRNAAHMQARATDQVLLDQAHVEPGRSAIQGSRVAGGPTTDDNQVVARHADTRT